MPTLLVFTLELLHKMIDEPVIEVFTAKVSVSCSSLDFEDALFYCYKRNIKSSSTKVEDKDVSFSRHFLVQTICDSSGGRLVNNPQYVQASNSSRILRCLTLRVIEVRRNCYDSIID